MHPSLCTLACCHASSLPYGGDDEWIWPAGIVASGADFDVRYPLAAIAICKRQIQNTNSDIRKTACCNGMRMSESGHQGVGDKLSGPSRTVCSPSAGASLLTHWDGCLFGNGTAFSLESTDDVADERGKRTRPIASGEYLALL